MLSHGNLSHNLELIRGAFGATFSSIGVSWLPPYHDMGLIGNIIEPLYVGATAVLMSPLAFLQRPTRWLHAISRYRGTISGAPNFAYDLCARKISVEERKSLDLSSWEQAVCGGEPVRHETLDRFYKAFEPCGFRREAFNPCYGLAESTLIVSAKPRRGTYRVHTASRPALTRRRVVETAPEQEGSWTLVSCGSALPSGRILIVDPDSRVCCPPDRVGEIWLAGPSVGHGYWNRDEETDHTFRAYLAGSGEGPFLRTGDLGFLDDGSSSLRGE